MIVSPRSHRIDKPIRCRDIPFLFCIIVVETGTGISALGNRYTRCIQYDAIAYLVMGAGSLALNSFLDRRYDCAVVDCIIVAVEDYSISVCGKRVTAVYEKVPVKLM